MEINFSAVIDKICRTCLGESNQMKPLQCKINGERTLLELVEETTNTTILMSNKLPQNICNECEDIICKSDAFKRNCIDTQRMLSEIVNGHKNTQNVVKIEIESGINSEVQNPYHCNVCSEKFPFIQNLIAHTMIHSKDEKKLKTEGTQLSFKDNLVSAIDIEIDPKFKLEKIEDTEKDFDNMDYDNDNSDLPSPSFSVPIVDEKPNQPKEKLKTCVCGKKLTKKVSYKAHLKKCLALQSEVYETEVKDVACMQCDMVFDTLNQFKNHLNKHKNEVVSVSTPKELYQCSMCVRKFIRKSSLDLHLQKHNKNDNVKHTCTHCKREFKHRAHLETHILIVHTRENGFACDICARQFSTKETLEIHKEGHNVKKLHKCDRCDKSFYMLSTLTDHIRSHTGEKPFLCSICGKGFSQKNNLGQHMRRHLGLKPFRCTECEKSFVSKGELEGHTRKHSGAHPFVCDECGNAFTTSSSLVKHRRTHTGERPYACDLCPMKFAASGTLTNHRRTHTGEKPFQCSYCDKAFVQRQDLVAHIRCHTGERPFVCNSCGQAFRKATGLKAHVKMHLKEPVKEGVMHGGGMLGGLS